MNGGCLTARGIGAPVRPPTVCVNRADVSDNSGSAWRSCSFVGRDRDRADAEPHRRGSDLASAAVSTPGDPALVVDVDVGAQVVGEAEAIVRPGDPRSPPWMSVPIGSGGGGSWWAIFIRVAILPIPSKRSDGIHETVVMLRSIRMMSPRQWSIHLRRRVTGPGCCTRDHLRGQTPPMLGALAPWSPQSDAATLESGRYTRPQGGSMTITVFLADDNLIVREGVKSLLEFEDDFEVVGQGADYDELVAGADATQPQVIVTDIRMPPDFSREGIDAAKEVRKRHPGTGVVILSPVRRPGLRGVAALRGGGRVRLPAQGPGRRGEPVGAGRYARSPPADRCSTRKIVEGLTTPVRADGTLSNDEEDLLQQVAQGRSRSRPSPCSARRRPPPSTPSVDALFATLAEGLDGRAGRQPQPSQDRSSGRSSIARSRASRSTGCSPAASPTRSSNRVAGPETPRN